MNGAVSYFVYLRVKEGCREWPYNTLVTLIDPPTNHKELETAIWLKCISQNPSAKEIEVISFGEAGIP